MNEETSLFFDAVRSVDFEDYGQFSIDRIEGSGSVSLLCSVSIDEEEGFHNTWSIRCLGVRRSLLRTGSFIDISLESEHILLREYREQNCRLGFRGTVSDPDHVVGALYEKHIEIAEDWIPVSAYLMDRKLGELVRGGFGVFAEGPESFILAYQETLERCGIETVVNGRRPNTEWNGSQFLDFPTLKVLSLDDCYLVAEDFQARKV